MRVQPRYLLIRFTCPDCYEFYEENIVEALGHKGSGDWSVYSDPTFDNEGVMHEKCAVCDGIASEKAIAILILGDADRDGTVTVVDLVVARNILLGENGDKYQVMSADTFADGVLDARDIVRLKKTLAGK